MSRIGVGIGDKVVECKHCESTGICQRATYQNAFGGGRNFYFCDRCGEGWESSLVSKRPTCKVCEGVGQVRI